MASEAEKSAYKFELSKSFSAGMVFRLLPKYKLRQIGEPIQYIDTLLIMSEKLACYVNFQVDLLPTEIDRAIEGPGGREMKEPPTLYPCPEYRMKDRKTLRYETFLSHFSDISWQINKHGGMSQTDD